MGFIDKKIDLIDDAYENYRNKCKPERGNEPDWMQPEIDFQYLTQEEFINEIKTDDKFAKRWGITIETKELNYEERCEISPIKRIDWENSNEEELTANHTNAMNLWGTPTKLTTITYNGQTQESYE